MKVVQRFKTRIFGRTVGFDLSNFNGQTLVFTTDDYEPPWNIGIGSIYSDMNYLLRHLGPSTPRNQLLDKLGNAAKNSEGDDDVDVVVDEGEGDADADGGGAVDGGRLAVAQQ